MLPKPHLCTLLDCNQLTENTQLCCHHYNGFFSWKTRVPSKVLSPQFSPNRTTTQKKTPYIQKEETDIIPLKTWSQCVDLGHLYIILLKNYFPKDPNSTEFAAQGILKVQSPLPCIQDYFTPAAVKTKLSSPFLFWLPEMAKAALAHFLSLLQTRPRAGGWRTALRSQPCSSSRVATGAGLSLLLLPLCPYALPFLLTKQVLPVWGVPSSPWTLFCTLFPLEGLQILELFTLVGAKASKAPFSGDPPRAYKLDSLPQRTRALS